MVNLCSCDSFFCYFKQWVKWYKFTSNIDDVVLHAEFITMVLK